MMGLGERKGICSFLCSLYYSELGHRKIMDDNISSMGTTSPPEVMPGAMLRERTDCYLDFTNEDCL